MGKIVQLSLSKESLEEQICATLREVGTIYEMPETDGLKVEASGPSFSDGWEGHGLISTAEALECFFIPYFCMDRVRELFWQEKLIRLSHVRQAIRYLVKDFEREPDNDGRLGLSGTPYINFKQSSAGGKGTTGIGRNLDFLDAGCFLLTCLLDAKAVSRERAQLIKAGLIDKKVLDIIESDIVDIVDARITACATMLKECDLGAGRGWTYTNDPAETSPLDFLYFTWNALECLEVLIGYLETAPSLVPTTAKAIWGGDSALENLKNLLKAKESYFAAKFLSPDNPQLYVCDHQVDFGEGDTNWYYNLFVLISLDIVGSRDEKKIRQGFVNLLDSLRSGLTFEKAKTKEHGRFFLAGDLYPKHRKQWSERAITPLIIKALATYRKRNPERFAEMLSATSDHHSEEQVISRYLDELGGTRVSFAEQDINNVWDKVEDQGYSIYYTERTLEALAKLFRAYFPESLSEAHYLDEITGLSEKKLAGGWSAPPQITVQITGDLIRQSIIDEAGEIARAQVKEMLSSSEFVDGVVKSLRQQLENDLRKQMVAFLGYAGNNIGADNPEEIYKEFLESLADIAGRLLPEIIFRALFSVAPSEMRSIEQEEFGQRIRQGLSYVAELEARQQGSVDYVKTLSEFQSKNLIQFVQAIDQQKRKG